MKNKIELKKCLIISLLTILIFEICFGILINSQYQTYTQNTNIAINGMVEEIIEKYPNADINKIIKIVNGDKTSSKDMLKEYGIDIKKDSLIYTNEKVYPKFLTTNLIFMMISLLAIVAIFIIYNQRKDRKIKEITEYIEEINRKNYTLKIQNNTEDELSILQNELYKITIMLKEQAENSQNDKINLKNSLADISHQLKTPLTSIQIMLDNIVDDENMSAEVRNDFIKDIRNEMLNISVLVNTILKLSKLDTNTIVFNKKKEKLNEIIEECKKNLLPICDLKNVTIEVEAQEDIYIECDKAWHKEAITNILKNCVEHSKLNQKVIVKLEKNKIYNKVTIKDFGEGISEKDLPHIFERFYKGENAGNGSIGIGLALAKAIIEKENGYISVTSQEGEGTEFVIKYMK